MRKLIALIRRADAVDAALILGAISVAVVGLARIGGAT